MLQKYLHVNTAGWKTPHFYKKSIHVVCLKIVTNSIQGNRSLPKNSTEEGYQVLGGIMGYVQKVFILWTIHEYNDLQPHWLGPQPLQPLAPQHLPFLQQACPVTCTLRALCKRKHDQKLFQIFACYNFSRHKVCLILIIPIQHFKRVKIPLLTKHKKCVNPTPDIKYNKMVLEPNVSPHKQIIKDGDVKECISTE